MSFLVSGMLLDLSFYGFVEFVQIGFNHIYVSNYGVNDNVWVSMDSPIVKNRVWFHQPLQGQWNEGTLHSATNSLAKSSSWKEEIWGNDNTWNHITMKVRSKHMKYGYCMQCQLSYKQG